jgi:glycerophosphoryl diester phosphodiesterase
MRVFDAVPVECGHRGSGRGVVGGHRENTLASFRAAVAAGLRWVEVDARRTADGVLVAAHDPVLDDGRFIATLPAAETDAAGLLRVADLLEDLPPEVGVDIDLKTSLEDATCPREATTAAFVADLAGPVLGRRPLLVTSFDPAALLVVRERRPELPVGLLTWVRFPLREAIPAAVHLGADVVGVHVGAFPLDGNPRSTERPAATSVRLAHDAGLQVLAWCPPPAEARELVGAGVDCLVVDDVG